MTRNRVGRRRILAGAATGGLSLVGAALIACGGDSKGTGTPAQSSGGTGATGTGAAGAGATSAVKKGGRFALAIDGDPPNFDMHAGTSSNTNYGTSPAYNQLVQFDPLVAVEGPKSIIADLADKWEISPDGMTYTFQLVKNAKFHDGTPFTSADVKASLERQKNPPTGLVAPRTGQLQGIQSMETPDPSTFVMKMGRPASPDSLLPILAQGWMSIYAKKDIDGKFDYKKGMNGTGPYRFKAYELGNRMTLDRNPEYFVKDQPYLDGVDVFIIPEASTRLAQFQSRNLALYSSNITDNGVLTKAMGDKVVIHTVTGICYPSLNFNTQKAPWSDRRVREAVSLAINRQDAINVLVKGDAVPGGYMPQGGSWALPEADLNKIPGYGPYSEASLAEAKKLLAAAGVQDGLQVELLVRDPQGDQNNGLMVADQLAKIGMKGKINPKEFSVAFDLLNKRQFDLAPWGPCFGLDDPDAIFAEAFLSDSPLNYSQIKSAEVDALYLKQSTELNPETRRKLVNELQITAMPLYGKVIYYWAKRHQAVQPYVKNFTTHTSLYSQGRFASTWFDK